MSVRFGRIAIKRPAACSDKAAPAQIELHVVEVREQPHSVVGKEAPVHWRLLTTHPVACVEDALQCVDWYRQRWHIEQLFRTLKKQGLDVESSQVETGAGLAKLACLAADNKLAPGETWVQASITGSQFEGRYEWDGERVRPFITGRAYMTADSTLLIDEQDPFAWGI